MGFISKISWIFFRFIQIVLSAAVVGIVGRYFVLVHNHHNHPQAILIYTMVVAVLSLFFALLFVVPCRPTLYSFPIDIIMFAMWIVAFGLELHLFGGIRCDTPKFYYNWSWFWGPLTVRFLPPFNPLFFISRPGCGEMRALEALSLIIGIFWIFSGLDGIYMFVRGGSNSHIRPRASISRREPRVSGMSERGDTLGSRNERVVEV